MGYKDCEFFSKWFEIYGAKINSKTDMIVTVNNDKRILEKTTFLLSYLGCVTSLNTAEGIPS